MNNSIVQVPLRTLEKLLTYLKQNEKDFNKFIDGKMPSAFLQESIDFSLQSRNDSNVKIAILKTKGYRKPNPDNLDSDMEMSEFDFNDVQYMSLTARLIEIAQKDNPTAYIKISLVMDCDTVQDCIDLVNKSSKLPSL